MKPFSQWTKQDVEEEFGLTAVFDSPVLQSWLHDIQDLWYFVVLDGKNYAESLAYDATKEEIRQIVGILRHTQCIIDKIIVQQ